MKDALPKIPRPLSQRWRDIRLRFVPVLTYLAGVAMVVYLWNTQWMPSNFTGEVQATMANVASPMDGELTEVFVQQFDRVTKGQVLGRVMVPTQLTQAKLATLRADLQVMRARMIQDQQRNDLNYEQLQTERVRQKAELDSTLYDLRYAQTDLVRTQQLRNDEYLLRMSAQVKEREKLVARLEQVLATMKPPAEPENDPLILDAIDKAIVARQEEVHQQTEMLLRAPMDGIVTKVNRNAGENTQAGESLITISSERSENIVGYIRQPISFEPKVGTTVMVRTRRGTQRRAAEAKIIKVGSRLEFFTQSLRVRGFDSSQERGLPILINAPQELALYPGELVDLAVKN